MTFQVKELGKEVNEFISYEQRVIKLSENRLFNIPALNFARETLNPTNSEISQVLNSMIQSEADEESNDKRKRLLIDLAMLKSNWANVSVNIRIYLYLANEDGRENVELFLGGVKKRINKTRKL